MAGRTYTVVLRVLPAAGDPVPIGEDVVGGSFDLGSTRDITLTIK